MEQFESLENYPALPIVNAAGYRPAGVSQQQYPRSAWPDGNLNLPQFNMIWQNHILQNRLDFAKTIATHDAV
jgi:hypothetical protein